MNSTTLAPNNPFRVPAQQEQGLSRDEWEDWTDEEDGADNDDILVDLSDGGHIRPSTSRGHPSHHRSSLQRPLRVKSKGRQKAQNAKAGIKLITDMSKFRRPVQMQQMKSAGSSATPKNHKFVDATALQALEGDPTSASIGSFSWLKRGKSKKTFDERSPNLSPDARPIMIGIQMPSDEAADQRASPNTTGIETPADVAAFQKKHNNKNLTPQQQRSVWSPDTEASESPYTATTAGPTTVYYSQPSGGVPPVPVLPATLKFKQNMGLTEADEDDLATPCTLFEEDGNSPARSRKSLRPRATPVSPESASSRAHGWWDHVTTPFSTKSANPFKQQQQQDAPSATSPQGWWTQTNEKEIPTPNTPGITIMNPAGVQEQYMAESSSSASRPGTSGRTEKQPENHSEKAKILLEENQTDVEEPPPYSYSPPKQANPVKFVAIPPPSHFAVAQQPVSSPGPMTPGLPGTMTSQGSINMDELPSDAAAATPREGALPERRVGAYVIGDHSADARGKNWKTERQRRRYEKEDAAATKAGGFWRGRGIFSENGCYGRTGHEGRKRRRVYLGIFGGLIAALILIVVLSVVLTQQAALHQSSSQNPGQDGAAGGDAQPSAEPPSVFLNLTEFPPMPTGVLTVVGPENPESFSGCMVDTADTAWSCSLPKADHKANEPWAANQPTFIFQVQYDNNTGDFWNNTQNGVVLHAPGISPNPSPPLDAEISFLGASTDDIKSSDKDGEPTPFYISLLNSTDQQVGQNVLQRRQGSNNAIGGAPDDGESGNDIASLLPPPEVNADGTPAPARLFPLPVQQPVRLFDRGLDTEHYGFYTYFNKTIFLSDKNQSSPADKDGGATLADARYVVTFAQTRFLVEMWTRKSSPDGGDVVLLNNNDGSSGTMPYPVTITEDLHGGDRDSKNAYYFGIDDDGGSQLNSTMAGFVTADAGADGTLVNGKNSPDVDMSKGGIDGGTGGCKCSWANFKTS